MHTGARVVPLGELLLSLARRGPMQLAFAAMTTWMCRAAYWISGDPWRLIEACRRAAAFDKQEALNLLSILSLQVRLQCAG